MSSARKTQKALKLNPDTITKISMRLLQPYTMRADSPYLSEDQQRLCRLSLRKRSEWMAEWLQWANTASAVKKTNECLS